MDVLCSPPEHLDLTHLLNPWMRWDEDVDRGLAVAQWHGLVAALEAAGARVRLLDPDPTTPAITFTRDLAVVVDDTVVGLTNLGPRAEREPRRAAAWFDRAGHPFEPWDAADPLEGGNVVPTAWGWLVGVRAGTDARPTRRLARHLRERTGRPAALVPLPDDRFAHLDMVLADLGPLLLVHPPSLAMAAWGAPHWDPIVAGRQVVEVTDDEALRLAVNVVRVGDVVIGDLGDRLARLVERAGLLAAPVPLGEPRKAGGGAHCLTLELPAAPADDHGRDARRADAAAPAA